MQRAETVAEVVGRLARGEEVPPAHVAAAGLPRDRVEAAVRAVREATRRWSALPVGEQWVVEWPAGGRRPGTRGRRR